jgi:hypothetical protein
MQEKEAMNLTNPRKLKVTKYLARFPFSLTFNNLSRQPNITTKLDLIDSHTYTENPSCTYRRYTPTRIGRLLNNETKEPNRKDRERERERESGYYLGEFLLLLLLLRLLRSVQSAMIII